MRIFSVSGRKVLERDLRAPFTFRLNGADTAPGLYVVEWAADGVLLRKGLLKLD
jgi:hypothetical protein